MHVPTEQLGPSGVLYYRTKRRRNEVQNGSVWIQDSSGMFRKAILNLAFVSNSGRYLHEGRRIASLILP